MPYPPPQSNLPAYHGLKWLVVNPALHLICGLRIYGQEHVLPNGPVLIVANHASNFDPLILGNCIGRPTAFMAKEELFQVPVLGAVIRLYGGFPVKRGQADRAALRSSLEAIAAGWVVALFIEGTRTLDGRITNPQAGAVLLAAKTGIPLVPAALWGTKDLLPKGQAWPRPAPVTVRFGSPIAAPLTSKRSDLEEVTHHCAERINQLLDLGR